MRAANGTLTGGLYLLQEAALKRSEFDIRVRSLVERYPWLFSGQHLGHDIMPGWLGLVEQLCGDIDRMVPADLKRDDGTGFHFSQIKEKWGALRVYWGLGEAGGEPATIDVASPGPLNSVRIWAAPAAAWSEKVNAAVQAAEEKSATICLFCGAPGHIRNSDGWFNASCGRHARAQMLLDK